MRISRKVLCGGPLLSEASCLKALGTAYAPAKTYAYRAAHSRGAHLHQPQVGSQGMFMLSGQLLEGLRGCMCTS